MEEIVNKATHSYYGEKDKMEDNKEIHINWKHENTRYSFLMMLDEEII